jgi:Tol biopolymer transport system component
MKAGDRLGPYEILSPIGSGGMGEVYRARDSRLDRIVAIKVSKEHFSERFEREARAVAALNHPNICTLHDVGPNYLVMEYIEGQPLMGPLPVDRALTFAVQICDALDAAHRKGIVHRDLKPGNILVTTSGIKLHDFGLARVTVGMGADAPTDPRLTQLGQVMGTPAYMSPEQWEGQPGDARSDIYALGCVLYEMLTGKTVAHERTPVQPAAIEAIVSACLEKDPEQRWQSVRDVRRALELPTNSGPPARNRWREGVGWIAAGVAVLGTLLYLAFADRPTAATGGKVRLSVNPPDNATFVGAGNVTVQVPLFALSPDGRWLVYSASTTGARSSLWLRPIEELEARVLPGTEDAQYPFWSPDGAWIAFFAEGKLKKTPAFGGPAQALVDVPDPRGGSWGADNTILYASGSTPIARIDASGGVTTDVTKLDASRKETTHRWPVWLPDGRHFLFTIRSSSVENSGIYMGSLDGPPQKLGIGSDGAVGYAAPGYVLFLEGTTLFAQRLDANRFELAGQPIPIAEHVGNSTNGFGSFSASTTGMLAYAGTLSRIGRLTWFDRSGNQVGTIGTEGEYIDFRFSPDDQRLAVSLIDPKTANPDIWLADITRGGNMSRFTFGPRVNATPIWSPDGTRIVFRTTRRGGLVEFYEKSAGSGGSEVPVLLDEVQRAAGAPSLNTVLSDWSPDGRNLLYSLNTTSRTELWLLPLVDDRKPVPFLTTQSDNMHATYSPNGHLVAYTSNESGRFDVYVQTFPLSDRKWTVSTTGGSEPRWRADGREIFYLSEDRKLMAVSVGPGPSFGVPKALFQTGVVAERVTPYRIHYAPNRDGSKFLVNTQSGDTPSTSISVVLNWTAGLEK